ncbi:hypothetical protein [Nocardioides sp. P5_E3]
MLPEWPNASCPLCGAAVWFWRNDAGSKVYFDAVGTPWPKHPCMDFSTAGPTPSPGPPGQGSTTATGNTRAPFSVESGPGCGLMMLWLVAVLAVVCVGNYWRLYANGDPNFETPTAPIIGTAVAVALVRAARRKSRRA